MISKYNCLKLIFCPKNKQIPNSSERVLRICLKAQWYTKNDSIYNRFFETINVTGIYPYYIQCFKKPLKKFSTIPRKLNKK